jgi:hypothetical protein
MHPFCDHHAVAAVAVASFAWPVLHQYNGSKFVGSLRDTMEANSEVKGMEATNVYDGILFEIYQGSPFHHVGPY